MSITQLVRLYIKAELVGIKETFKFGQTNKRAKTEKTKNVYLAI